MRLSRLAALPRRSRIASPASHRRPKIYFHGHGFLVSCTNQTRRLLSIGYRLWDQSLDTDCYDLLASEARLTSFIGIAKGDVTGGALVPVEPRRHPCRTGRRADFVVGLDVRIFDACAGDAQSGQ